MKNTLTAKQSEIYEFIKDSIIAKGYPPTVRDICDAVHLKSTSSVHSHLNTLEEKGYIRRDPALPRAIEILDDNFNLSRRELVNVPIVGRVACGEPIFAEENTEGYFPIPPEYLGTKKSYMLKVRGDSMVNVGIFDGDLVLVEEANSARNSEIVVALVEDGATVKRFFKENGHIRLQPENDNLDPIIVDDCTIMGKVIGLFRMM